MHSNPPAARTKPSETKLVICVWHSFSLWRPPESLPQTIRAAWPPMKVVHLPQYEMLPEELPDMDIFVGYSIRPEQFQQARKIKWIHSTAAAVGQLMYPELRRSGVLVTNIRGIHAVPIAEHVLGAMLALARRLPDALRYQAQRKWAQQEIWDASVRPRELDGSVLLLVGFGSIGREIAKRARVFGMRITAITRSGKGDPALADRILSAPALDDVLPEADFLVLAAPETPETTRMMSARQFQRMKRTAYLINVARGTLVDEAALAEALARGTIAGAALDVAEREPLCADSPLWNGRHVILTPHMSAVTDHLWERQTALLMENLERWFDGRELLNRVNLERGY